ncbi:hypothetical protein, partial [Ruminococcus sp.]|uniref:hypothetical protein n=1 Tax=Ruminococcus sp. TaxID=41978 RepID=UPI002E7657CD
MIIFVICIIAAAVGAVAVLCVLSRRNSEEARYKGAAANIYRDKLLKWSLMNPYQSAENVLSADDSLFVYIKNAHSKGKHQYVFCVGDKVYIGRGRRCKKKAQQSPWIPSIWKPTGFNISHSKKELSNLEKRVQQT